MARMHPRYYFALHKFLRDERSKYHDGYEINVCVFCGQGLYRSEYGRVDYDMQTDEAVDSNVNEVEIYCSNSEHEGEETEQHFEYYVNNFQYAEVNNPIQEMLEQPSKEIDELLRRTLAYYAIRKAATEQQSGVVAA